MPSKTEKETPDFFDQATEAMKDDVVKDEGEIGAEEWDPQSEGQALRGVFIKAVPKPTRFGVGYNVVVKDLDTEEFIKVWCKRSMLRSQLLEASPKQGGLIVFLYNGLKEGQQNDYHSYQVRADSMDADYWSRITRKGAEEQIAFDATGGRPNQENAAPASQLGPDEAPY